jgi:mono/diheme cytochrome c family protein
MIAPAALALLAVSAFARGQENPERRVRDYLTAHCADCHGEETKKKGLRLDTLPLSFSDRTARDRWELVLEKLRQDEMPPKARPRPKPDETKAVLDWIASGLEAAERAKRAREGRTTLRRLNRVEYENTVRDLLEIHVDLQDLLPPDSQAAGFDTVGEAHHVSSFLMERYLEAADRALGVAVANTPQPPAIRKRYSLKDERQVKTATERVYRALDDGLVLFSSSAWNSIVVGQFYPSHRGLYRFRISARAVQSDGKPVTYRVDGGPMLMGTKNHLIDYFDAAPDAPSVAEFSDRLEARSHIRIHPYGLAPAQAVNKVGAADYTGPGLAVHWVEVEGPLHDTWPPASHRRLFGDLPQAPAPGGRLEVVSPSPAADAERLLRAFARRAFRRAVTDDDLRPLLSLVRSKLEAGRSFEQAVRAGFTAVLVSPEFLFLREEPGPLDDFALAARLSYFLWSAAPDEELLGLAERGRLRDRETRRRQVERLLRHPKASAFTTNFVGQWLGLRDIDFTVPSHLLYPEYDEMLNVSTVRETELFFSEVLEEDLSLANFVASDFSMLNGRLAKHYGIPGVEGWAFRKVALPPESHRGGVLTMASVLKVTANGTTTSPVLRGAWVLDRILGTPPPRPPSDVPAVEPDIRGATTIREQLARHRAVPACASCHARIDPPGFALESFDVIGGWRDYYRTTGRGKPVHRDGRRMPYLQGPAVDPADALPDGRRFATVDEFKRLLLADLEPIARALTVRLVTYATGGPPGAVDRPEIDAIVRRAAARNYGLRALVHEVVESSLFREK